MLTIGPQSSKKLFKVGMNEGIIMTRQDLGETCLFTDGLSGCVALVVINKQCVFMAHVYSGSEPSTIDARAKQYLDDITSWMKHNGGEPIKVALVANGLGDKTIQAFKKACDELGLYPTIKESDSCSLMLNVVSSAVEESSEDDIFVLVSSSSTKKKDKTSVVLSTGLDDIGIILDTKSKPSHKPYDIIGTWKTPDLAYYRIDANGKYKFEGNEGMAEVFSADYDSHFEGEILKSWATTPALRLAVSELLKSVGDDVDTYGYLKDLLTRIDDKLAIYGKGLLHTDRLKMRICNALVMKIREADSADMDSIIKDVVSSQCKLATRQQQQTRTFAQRHLLHKSPQWAKHVTKQEGSVEKPIIIWTEKPQPKSVADKEGAVIGNTRPRR